MPELPTISVVTPSFNQVRFLGECLRSVLDQGYPGLEHVVVDGGSTDGSVEVIREHQDRLAMWVSESDAGQYDAINKGFGKTSGEIMAWLNSDDVYFPGALSAVGEVFAAHPQIEWVTTAYPVALDERGRTVACRSVPAYARRAFFRGRNLAGPWFHTGYVQQESTFWRRSLWERAGGFVDTSVTLAADFELWARFFSNGAELVTVQSLLGGFRQHGDQRTASGGHDEYTAQAVAALRRHGGRPPGRMESRARAALSRWVPTERAGSLRGPAYAGSTVRWDGARWRMERVAFL